MLFELVMQGLVAGQETINRWNYLVNETTDDHLGSFGLINAVGGAPTGTPPAFPVDTLMYTILLALSEDYVITGLAAKAIYDPADFYELGITPGAPGAIAGIVMSPILAYGFRTNRRRTDIRRATKRFAGVPQGSLTSNGVLPSGTLDLLNAIGAIMNATLSYTPGGTAYNYVPAVVHKLKTTDIDGKVHINYYPTESEQRDHLYTGFDWEAYSTVRGQESRQYGKGK